MTTILKRKNKIHTVLSYCSSHNLLVISHNFLIKILDWAKGVTHCSTLSRIQSLQRLHPGVEALDTGGPRGLDAGP